MKPTSSECQPCWHQDVSHTNLVIRRPGIWVYAWKSSFQAPKQLTWVNDGERGKCGLVILHSISYTCYSPYITVLPLFTCICCSFEPLWFLQHQWQFGASSTTVFHQSSHLPTFDLPRQTPLRPWKWFETGSANISYVHPTEGRPKLASNVFPTKRRPFARASPNFEIYFT